MENVTSIVALVHLQGRTALEQALLVALVVMLAVFLFYASSQRKKASVHIHGPVAAIAFNTLTDKVSIEAVNLNPEYARYRISEFDVVHPRGGPVASFAPFVMDAKGHFALLRGSCVRFLRTIRNVVYVGEKKQSLFSLDAERVRTDCAPLDIWPEVRLYVLMFLNDVTIQWNAEQLDGTPCERISYTDDAPGTVTLRHMCEPYLERLWDSWMRTFGIHDDDVAQHAFARIIPILLDRRRLREATSAASIVPMNNETPRDATVRLIKHLLAQQQE